MKSKNIKTTMVSTIVVAMLLFCSVFISAEINEGAPSGPITFDLNGGTFNGSGSFVMTVEDLADGLPDITGAINGTKEFVVWSKEKLIYSDLYNPGDEAPSSTTTLYAIWGVKVTNSSTVTINTGGCYIVENLFNANLNIGGTGDVLIVLDNVDKTDFQITKNTTFIVRGDNINNTYGGWNNYKLEFSSASTGHISFKGDVHISGPIIINGNVTVGKKIHGSNIYIGGNVVATDIESPGNVTIKGTVNVSKRIQGLTGVDIDGTVTADSLYSGGPMTIKGTVTVNKEIQGSSIDIEGTVTSKTIYTGGALNIDGDVTVSQSVQGTPTTITGTLVAGSIWPAPYIGDSAVIIIGGVAIVPPGKEYLILTTESSFNTSGVTNINVQFGIMKGTQPGESSLNLIDFNNRIYLATGVKILQESNGDHIINVYYSHMGKEYHSVGKAIYIAGSPGYYTCIIGEGTEVGAIVEDPLVIISYPTIVDSDNIIYVNILQGSMSVKLVKTGTSMIVSEPDVNGIVSITIPELSEIYGFWGTWDSIGSPDVGYTNEYTIIDQTNESSGTCVLFVTNYIDNVDSKYYVTTPICFVIAPELAII
jgi:cytoskeletal protein CcmA (bactofilin family)